MYIPIRVHANWLGHKILYILKIPELEDVYVDK